MPTDHVSRGDTFSRQISESIPEPEDHVEVRLIGPDEVLPAVVMTAQLVTFGDQTPDGRLVDSVAVPWFTIIELLRKDPKSAYEIEPRQWEEILAGAYERAGFDEVILTPRAGDHGRDVIATRTGVGSIRIFGEMKAYAPNRPVPAEAVRALGGVIMAAQNVSKGVISTTSTFAPRVEEDRFIKPLLPHRIELMPWNVLFPWLLKLAKKPNK